MDYVPTILYSTHKSRSVFCFKLTITDVNATHAQSPIIISNHTHFYHILVNFCHLFFILLEEDTLEEVSKCWNSILIWLMKI